MSDKLHYSLNRWIGLEQEGRDDLAERELVQLFRLIPSPAPREDFVDRVIARSAIASVPELVFGRSLGIAVKMAVCVTLLLSALTAAVAPSVLLPLLRLINPVKMLAIGVDMVVEVFRRLAESVAVWRALAGFGEAMGQLLQSPIGTALFIMGFILSAGVLRALAVLIESDQRGGYVSFV